MPSSSLYNCRHSSSNSGHEKYDSFPNSPSRCSLERPTRDHSRDSAYSRSDREGSYDRLTNQADHSSYSHMNRALKIPSYDRMVCAAVARLKNRNGSSIREIAKNVRDKYGMVAKAGSEGKISSTAKRLVREGKLVKDGNHFRLRKERTKNEGGSVRDTSFRTSRHREGGSGNKRSPSPSPRQHRRTEHRSASQSRSRSRSISLRRGRRRRRRRRRRRSRRRGRTRGSVNSLSRSGKRSNSLSRGGKRNQSLSRGGKRRKKGGMRSQKRRLTYGRRNPHKRKYTRNKRKNKGWFGSWFRRGSSGQSSNSGQGGSSSGANKGANKGGNKQDSGKQAK